MLKLEDAQEIANINHQIILVKISNQMYQNQMYLIKYFIKLLL